MFNQIIVLEPPALRNSDINHEFHNNFNMPLIFCLLKNKK